MIKAHEIQGGLALLNSFNRVGLDHVVLVKVASTAVVSKLLCVFNTVQLISLNSVTFRFLLLTPVFFFLSTVA